MIVGQYITQDKSRYDLNDVFRCQNLLLLPGVGKTTVVRKACKRLHDMGVPIQGFYTEEVRSGGRRTGFDVVTMSGTRGKLARVRYTCIIYCLHFMENEVLDFINPLPPILIQCSPLVAFYRLVVSTSCLSLLSFSLCILNKPEPPV